AHALAEGDGALHFRQGEAGQDVAGEQRLDPPHLAAAGRLAIAEARAEDLDRLQGAQALRGDVLAFRLAAHAVPGRGGGRRSGHWPSSFWITGSTRPALFIQFSSRAARSIRK